MNQYLIPSNSKRSLLIFGVFNYTDLLIFGLGLGASLLMLMISDASNTVSVIIGLLPGLISGFLVFPIPNYHNTLTFLISMYKYYTKREKYVWKGWCFENGETVRK
jgi:hypothetical protein